MSDLVRDQKGSLRELPGKSVSYRLRASISTEAALAFPLFFLACVLIALLLEMTALDLRVRSSVVAAARKAMAEQVEFPALSVGEMENIISQEAGFNYLDTVLMEGGKNGVSLAGSTMDPATGIGHVCWQYSMKLPFPVLRAAGGTRRGRVRIKAWNGYHGELSQDETDEIVYVTPYGIVYHSDPGCTHLSLSVQAVSADAVGTCRNQNGGKYYPCAHCARAAAAGHQTLYIAKEGDRYHTDRQCSGLKRSVEAIPLSQVGGRRPCSRCSK